MRARIADGRYRLVRQMDAGDAAERIDGVELRSVLFECLDDEPAFRDGTLRRLCEELGVPSPPHDPTAWERSDWVERAVGRLTRVGTSCLVREPEPQVLMTVSATVEADEYEGRSEDLEWIEIQLVDEEGDPVAQMPYRIELSDHRVRTGVTNSHGIIRYDRIPGGTCKFTFTRLEEDAWEHA